MHYLYGHSCWCRHHSHAAIDPRSARNHSRCNGIKRPCWPGWSSILPWWVSGLVSISDSSFWNTVCMGLGWRRCAKAHCHLGDPCAVRAMVLHWFSSSTVTRTYLVPPGYWQQRSRHSFISRFGYDPGTSCCPGSVRHLHAKISDFPKHLSHSWSLESTGWWFESLQQPLSVDLDPAGFRDFDHLACLLPKTVESRLGISTSSIVKKNCGSPVTVGLNWLVFGELVLRLVDFRWIFGALGTPPLREFGFLTGPVILGLCSRLMGGFSTEIKVTLYILDPLVLVGVYSYRPLCTTLKNIMHLLRKLFCVGCIS